MSYYWILCVAICLVESSTQGALYEAKLAISPNPFKPLIDETLMVLCQLEKKVSTEAREFKSVNRITIKKGSIKVAKLTSDLKEVQVFNDFAKTCPYQTDCGTGNGKLDIDSTAYMQVKVRNLMKSLKDTYTCDVEGTDDNGDSVTATDTYTLDSTDATISEIVDKLQGFQAEMARLGHTEGGHVDCGGSYDGSWKSGLYRASWTRVGVFHVTKKVRVDFKTPYSKPPVVQLSVMALDNNKEATYYGAVVESVDTRGFLMRCMTLKDPRFRVWDMDISWTSVAVY